MNRSIVAAVLFVLSVSASLMAAPTPGENVLNREFIQAERKALVEKNMGLDSETAKKFWPLYDAYAQKMQKVGDRAQKLLQDYALNWGDLSDEKASELIDEFEKVQEEKLKVRRESIKMFRKSLPPKVVARFFQIENKLDSVINYDLVSAIPLVR